MPQKLHLVSIFGSQFKIGVFRPRVEKSAQLSAAPLSEYAETLHELLAPPTADIEPLSCYLKKDLVTSLVQRLGPWLSRHQSAKSVTLFVPTAFGRWSEDMQFLPDLFPQARLKIYLTESQLPETEAFSSQRMLVKPIGSRRRSWFAAVARLLFSRPNPLIIVAGRGQERLARWLSIGCVRCECIVAPRVNNLILGLRAASADKSPSA